MPVVAVGQPVVSSGSGGHRSVGRLSVKWRRGAAVWVVVTGQRVLTVRVHDRLVVNARLVRRRR